MRTDRLLTVPRSIWWEGGLPNSPVQTPPPTLEAGPPPKMQTPTGMQTPLVMWPVMYAGKPTPLLWTEGMTDVCENITLPQTSFAGGKYCGEGIPS